MAGPADMLTALVADQAGQIFDLEGYAAVGLAGSQSTPLATGHTIALPYGSELLWLPDRRPMVYNLECGRIEVLEENPYEPGQPVFPVSAFNSPGHVITQVCAYREKPTADPLPLFSYGAVGWHTDGFRSAAQRVDNEPRQDLRHMPDDKIRAGIDGMRAALPGNRLREHLENCALTYGCPAGKNFFLGRYEAPLPTAQTCNARCLGCISLQPPESGVACSQDRIAFTPSADEIAEVALAHIARVDQAVVSFGQGCEGDPLLAAEVIGPAIRQIRRHTQRGTINLNTNASLPLRLEPLITAGLDSIRISLNSAHEPYYKAYFRPRNYHFADVCRSADLAIAGGLFVSINYLNLPGLSDTQAEFRALAAFIDHHPINMIQWRNLNFDPRRYWRAMRTADGLGEPFGIPQLVSEVSGRFPHLQHGYFNPPKERWLQRGAPSQKEPS
jgi:pyruvate-formate lyase-activating enzyme